MPLLPSSQDDNKLLDILKTNVEGDPFKCKWPEVADHLGSGRTGKQCRDRWLNYLRPGIKKGDWSKEEEVLLEEMYAAFGPKYVGQHTG
jgi:myb proto-oncogene protein